MTQTAYQYVTDVLELVQEADETVQEYLERVAYSFQEMDEKAWDQLPVSCQQWYNDAADVLVAKNEAESNDQEFTGALAELPGMSEPAPKAAKAAKAKEKKPTPAVTKTEAVAEALEDAAEAVADAAEAVETAAEVVAEAAEDAAEDASTAPKKGRGRPKGSPTLPKEERAAKAEKQPRGPIAAASVRKLMCENMDLTLDEVMEKLGELGVEMQRSSAQVNFGLAA